METLSFLVSSPGYPLLGLPTPWWHSSAGRHGKSATGSYLRDDLLPPKPLFSVSYHHSISSRHLPKQSITKLSTTGWMKEPCLLVSTGRLSQMASVAGQVAPSKNTPPELQNGFLTAERVQTPKLSFWVCGPLSISLLAGQ